MILLCLETSTRYPSLALFHQQGVMAEIFWEGEDIAASLLEQIKHILSANQLQISAIDSFVVSLGPGSWTGVRVGLSFAKGLACGRSERIYGLLSMETILFACRKEKRQVCCLVNAYRGNFYYYSTSNPASFIQHSEIRCAPIREILSSLEPGTLLVGPGLADIPPEMLDSYENLEVGENSLWYPAASAGASLAWLKIQKGLSFPPLEPFYGR